MAIARVEYRKQERLVWNLQEFFIPFRKGQNQGQFVEMNFLYSIH